VKTTGFFAALVLCASAVLAQSADITVLKSGPDQAAPDTDVTWLISITNVGPDDSPGVTLDDPVPAGMTFVSFTQTAGPTFTCVAPGTGGTGTVSCTIANLANGATADFTLVTHIDPSAAPGSFFTNVATATSTIDPNSENDSGVATVFTPSAAADLGVTKLGPTAASPGDNVSYSLTFTNGGPNDAPNAALNDTLPGNMTFVSLDQTAGFALSCTTPAVGAGGTVTCTTPSFPTGQTATLTLTVNIPSDTPSGTEYANIAGVSSDIVDPNVENDVATTSVLVSAVDLSVTKTSTSVTANAGEVIAYTLTVTNAGPDAAAFAVLVDELPPATTFVSITQNNGEAASCSAPAPGTGGTVSCAFPLPFAPGSAEFTLAIRAGDTTSITNTATAGTESSDTNPSNNSDSFTTTVTPVADVSVTKTAPASAPVGSDLTFTVTVTNNGPSTVNAVTLSDAVPAGTTFVSFTQTTGATFTCTTPASGGTGTIACSIATLPPAATAMFSLVVAVPPYATPGATITNTATVTGTPESNGTNNSATANSLVTPDVPLLTPFGLAALALVLALLGTWVRL
jgi:uncharacterized repeat protein (TIGR01451 family)